MALVQFIFHIIFGQIKKRNILTVLKMKKILNINKIKDTRKQLYFVDIEIRSIC